MIQLIVRRAARLDVRLIFERYEAEKVGLGARFLTELGGVLERARSMPRQFPELGSSLHRALLRKISLLRLFSQQSRRGSGARCASPTSQSERMAAPGQGRTDGLERKREQEAAFVGSRRQRFVGGPELGSSEPCAGQKVRIHRPEPSPLQPLCPDQSEHLVQLGNGRSW